MKKSWLIVALLLVVMPLAGTAEVIRVTVDVPTIEAGIAIAEDGDTLLIPTDMSHLYVDVGDKDIIVGLDGVKIPDGYKPPPQPIPFPDTPVE